MKTVQLAELTDAAEEIRNGETVLIRDGETLIAEITPVDAQRRQEEHLETLIREGKATRRGTGRIDVGALRWPPVGVGAGVLEQLLEDRRSDR